VEQILREEGAADSVIIFGPGRKWRFNFLQYILKRPGIIGSRTEQIVNVLTTASEIANRNQKTGGGGDAIFFEQTNKRVIRNAVDICVMTQRTMSMSLLNDLITSAPRTDEEVQDTNWQQTSACYQLITEGDNKKKSAVEQNDFDTSCKFFLREFCNFPPETRGSVLATWGAMADPLLRGQMLELFGGETNFIPDLSFEGVTIITDFPVKTYGAAGVMAQGIFKYLWELAAAQRDVSVNARAAYFFCDEFTELVHETDADFFATTARGARICSVVITQTISGYYAALGGEAGRHRTEQMLGALNTKIFHANSGETNRYASGLFAKDWQTRANFSSSRGAERDTASGGGSDMLESKVLEAEFTTLRKGGPANNFCTEAIVFQGGRVFKATGETFLKTIFRQKVR
jgi:type IV secretory pathway TraG/TraD family ATPase VirD4